METDQYEVFVFLLVTMDTLLAAIVYYLICIRVKMDEDKFK